MLQSKAKVCLVIEIYHFLSGNLCSATTICSTAKWNPKMVIRKLCGTSSTRSSCQKTYLHKVRLVNILDGYCFFTDCSSQCIKSNGASVVEFYYSLKQLSVCIIKTQLVNFKLS